MAHKTQTWVFFYSENLVNNILVTTGIYKEPGKTKTYKNLMKKLAEPNVRSVGYMTFDEWKRSN